MMALTRLLAFYTALFAAFGVASPFLPALLQQDGLQPSQLGVVLAAGTAVRLVAGPIGGRLADRTGRAPLVLAGFTAVAAAVALLYIPARGVVLLTLLSVAHASVLAPLTPVADALALGSSQTGRRFRYGWVRGAGSAAFIGGALLSGQLVDRLGLGIIIWLNAGMLAAAACLGRLLPNRMAGPRGAKGTPIDAASAWDILRLGVFVRLMVVAGLIGGSHALHDGFEVIRWRAAGLSAEQSSVLWALSVAAEVIVFVLVGPMLLRVLGSSRAMLLAALAGIIRWGIAAQTAWFPIMAVVEPLHGLTFALLHLACMEMIASVVPVSLAATAQAFYGTVAMGATTVLVTLASGPMYAQFGAKSYWVMAGMCALALPVASGLRDPVQVSTEHARAACLDRPP
jgi:PPP family 3-phenylpropionic acid transporter